MTAARLTRAAMAMGLGLLAVSGRANAADKQQCLDTAPRGQDLRDEGKLLEAREAFRICADTACPDPVPKYCAEWLDGVNKRIPSLLVRVTDESGRDLADAVVTIDSHAVVLDGRPYTVVGVLPATFALPDQRQNEPVGGFIPLRPITGWMGDHSNQAIARLRPGVTLEQAREDARRVVVQHVHQVLVETVGVAVEQETHVGRR